jgi:hypothetical protein
MRLNLSRCLLPAALFLSGCVSGIGSTEGKEAPPISGPDSAERPMELSEYRGKVVLVDFWRTG